MIHGFTSTPTDIRPLSKHLHAKGFSVRELLLPGHGTSFEDMARYGWQDWLDAAQRELAELKTLGKNIWVVGFSMGGTIAALAASGETVQGLVSIAAPIWPRPKRTRYAWLLQYFQKYAQMGKRQEYRFPSWRYEQVAVKNIADLMHLIRLSKSALAKVTIPALVVQGSADRTIEPRSAEYIFKQLGSQDKELFIVPDGSHMLLLESESEAVCNRIANFIFDRIGGR